MTHRNALALTDVVCASPNHMTSRVGDELALLDLDRSVYYGLDPVGARIWELLQSPIVLSVVRDAMVAEFEVDHTEAGADLIALVEDLLKQQLVSLRASNVP